MKITANEQQLQQVRNLWKDCFHDTKEYMDFYFSWKTKDNEILGLYDDDKLISMLHLNPYEIMMNQKKRQSYYIVGVATDSNYRKRGLMRRLLTEALNQMYEEKVPFTYLMPAKEAIYLPFDFRIVTMQKRLSIPVAKIQSMQRKNDLQAASLLTDHQTTGLEYAVIQSEDTISIQSIRDFANQFLYETEDVYTIRSVSYYQRMIAELKVSGGDLLAIKKDGKVTGYLAFVLEMGKAEVLELLSEPEYENSFLDLLAEEVRKRAGDEETEVAEPSTAPPMMARIVCLTEFLQQLRASEEIELVIKVSDSLISENCGSFLMECGRNSCKVTKLSDSASEAKSPEISGDIAKLTQFFFGTLSSEETMELIGASKKETCAKLDKLQLLNRIYLNEIV